MKSYNSSINKRYYLRTLGLALLLGLMVPGLGGLIFPSMLINIAGPFITSGNQHIVLDKYDYSYKPGQSGTNYNFYRFSENGKAEDITIQLLAYSFLIYSLVFIVILFLLMYLKRKFYDKTN